MRPNWFIAAPVSGADIAARLPAPPAGVRCFDGDDLHLTIAFLGAVDELQARSAFAALQWPVGTRMVSFGAVVPMGNPRQFSALSALLDHGREAIEAAIAATRGAAYRAAGISGDQRSARAHVTLGRVRRQATGAEREAALGWARAIDFSGIEATLDGIALYTWSEERAHRLFRIAAWRRQ